MDVISAIKSRHSTRAFLDKAVSKEEIIRILEAARFAPSGVNTQPWQCWVVTGATISKIEKEFIDNLEAGTPSNKDYKYYPDEWFEPYKSRRFACGVALYEACGIQRDDKAARKEQWYRNYNFFGAPVGIIIGLDKRLAVGSYMDTAMFMQNIMLAAKGLGLDTCPQASIAEYPDVIRKICSIDKNVNILCGIAVGWADKAHPVNNYQLERAKVDSFTHWVE